MRVGRVLTWVGAALVCLAVFPTPASAQSAIAGIVKDTSGGVLPGVTVEVASDVLIEKTKSSTTDGGGQYRIVDLRPGLYKITFTLSGFGTVIRDAFQLPSDTTASVNIEMKVGTLEETITVTGLAPIVDVQSAAHVQVLDRDSLDNVPTGRTIQGIGQLIVGIALSSPDVGGAKSTQQTYMSVRGTSSANNTVMIDGMVVNGLQGNGSVQAYSSDANAQEMTYQTSGVNAERSGGGVTLNMVPKEGGNRFSGTASYADRPGQWQGDNYTQRLQAWGLPKDAQGNPAINRTLYISHADATEGGPIKKDKLWFFTSFRDFQTNLTVANTFFDNGKQGSDWGYTRNPTVRLTYQLSPRNKFSGYYERTNKYRQHNMGAFADPETTATQWTTPNYSTAAMKYTGTLSSRILVEGGYSQNIERYNNPPQSGIAKTRGSPEWYATVPHSATGGGVGVASNWSSTWPTSIVYQGSIAYVTGSHHAKAGAQFKRGWFYHYSDGNGSLSQVYPSFTRAAVESGYNVTFPTTVLLGDASPCSGVQAVTSCSVTINNQPRGTQERLKGDLGLFVQDSFTMKRLTVNAGIRYETINSQVDQWTSPAGRFVPARAQPERPNIPDWKDWAPRFQVVYDLFGDAKTAIKYSASRYNNAETTDLAAGFTGLSSSTSSRNWTDLNQDDIAQGERTWSADGTSYVDCIYLTPGCEINLSGNLPTQGSLSPTFGLISEAATYQPFPRQYRIEHGVEVQHALLPRLSLTGTWYHTRSHNLTKTVNRARRVDDYFSYLVYNPINGRPITYYNSTADYQARATDNVANLEPLNQSWYDTYSAEFRMRPFAGASISGGISIERSMSVNCASSDPTLIVDPNIRLCDSRAMVEYDGGPVVGKPFTKDFKVSGSFPIWYGITFGASYQNLDQGALTPTYLFNKTIKYPDGTSAFKVLTNLNTPACPTTYGCVPGALVAPTYVGSNTGQSVTLFASGTVRDERVNQLDLKASRNFRVRRVSIQPTLELFNVFNIDNIQGRSSSSYSVSGGTYLQPSSMLQGRLIGVGANVKW